MNDPTPEKKRTITNSLDKRASFYTIEEVSRIQGLSPKTQSLQ